MRGSEATYPKFQGTGAGLQCRSNVSIAFIGFTLTFTNGSGTNVAKINSSSKMFSNCQLMCLLHRVHFKWQRKKRDQFKI